MKKEPSDKFGRPFAGALEQLRRTGMRPTRQRMALAKLLLDGGKRHITAESLHAEAAASGIRVSLATVYNTLHQFTGVGLLREVVVDAGITYFDTRTNDHHHTYCQDDGTLRDVDDGDFKISSLPKPPKGTEIERVDVVIRVKSKGQ